jgi:primosomal protein N' (replication factor Y) (superfamily II helicase)
LTVNDLPILHIALDTPLRRVFDYLPPAGDGDTNAPRVWRNGVRLLVPFGRRRLVGVLIATSDRSELPRSKLKAAIDVLDNAPVFDPACLQTMMWAAEYYHHPIGEVFAAAMPKALRSGQSSLAEIEVWKATATGLAEIQEPTGRRAPQQRSLLAFLAAHGPCSLDTIRHDHPASALRQLVLKQWVCSQPAPAMPLSRAEISPSPFDLSVDQQTAVTAICASLGRFQTHLLFGVTGSGKTEVYLQAIATAVASGGQALVLVPEIALTPQLVARFTGRFRGGIAVLHSGLTDNERRDHWRRAHSGSAQIVIGTRSAVFAPLPRLALVIVDEEHDASFKQHEGFRYSARDVAVVRAQRAAVPVVLGSATPSLESLENAAQNRYSRLSLPSRTGQARAPALRVVDLRAHAATGGIAQPAIYAAEQHLQAGGQVIVFLNRRGYAPTLFCNHCGWVAPCKHCDARLTLHRRAAELRCHHCGASSAVPSVCGACRQELMPVGQGTEQVEETLTALFPDAPVVRLDRDAASGRGAIDKVLARVHSGVARILLGTQMLTKGHDFPDVSLVIVLDADQGLFATDYRATERLAQTIVQVAGRAGRAQRPGEVLIQTQFPDHPLLKRLLADGYGGFAAAALAERAAASWPPYSRLALLRADARDAHVVEEFLGHAAKLARQYAPRGIEVLGPATALMARRADRHRAQLLIEAPARSSLQRFLKQWLAGVETLPTRGGLRWSLDVDPIEV